MFDSSPTVADLLAGTLKVAGSCFVEIFCGQAAFTLCLMLSTVPCICPWDVKFGSEFNVLTHGMSLLSLIKHCLLTAMHFAVPCLSMTWARWPQLRTSQHPQGKPDLSDRERKLVETGNALLAFTVECCRELWLRVCFFSIENPELSWLWLQAGLLEFLTQDGVALVRILFKHFAVPFMKPTLFMHNTPTLHRLREPEME